MCIFSWLKCLFFKKNKIDSAQHCFASPRRQLFSIPYTTICSMLENPSSHKGLLKLYQTCKYFYAKRPIIIADYVHMDRADNGDGKQALVASFNGLRVCVEASQFKVPVWLTKTISISCYYSHKHHYGFPRFFRYSLINIIMYNCYLQFEDFVLLASEKNVEILGGWQYYDIVHSDGTKPSIDELLPHLPNIKSFYYFIDDRCTYEILTKLHGMEFNHKFSHFHLNIEDVHPTFDLKFFCEFILKNCDKDTDLWIYPGDTMRHKIRPQLTKLDPKWKNETLEGLKTMFSINEERMASLSP